MSDSEFDDNDSYGPTVLDIGSSQIRCGFSGESSPHSIVPNIVGESRFKPAMLGASYPEKRACEMVNADAGLYKITHPIENGAVQNWDDMETVLHHVFNNELRVDTTEQKVIMNDSMNTSLSNRENFTQIMFETFEVPELVIQPQEILGAYASGRTTCLNVCLGDGVTSVVPIYEGYLIQHAVKQSSVSQRDLTDFFYKRLNGKNILGYSSDERMLTKKLKEDTISTSKTRAIFETPTELNDDETYILPDGETITLHASDLVETGEIIFRPDTIGKQDLGLASMIWEAIQACPRSMRPLLRKNITIMGGGGDITGFNERLDNELQGIADDSGFGQNFKYSVRNPPERLLSTWIGASIVSSLSNFSDWWVKKEMYDEVGPNVMHLMHFNHQ